MDFLGNELINSRLFRSKINFNLNRAGIDTGIRVHWKQQARQHYLACISIIRLLQQLPVL